MYRFSQFFVLIFLLVLSGAELLGQCKTWNDSPKKEEAEQAHSLYRDVVRSKQVADLVSMSAENFNHGFNNWKKAYAIAPAADGNRAMHFSDGRKFFKALLERESTDEEKKKTYYDRIFELYDEQIVCYKNEGYLLGRKAFDMFYAPIYGFRPATYEAFKKAIEKGGKNTEYIVFDPVSKLVKYLYQNDKVSKEEARNIYIELEEIADHNIENNKKYGQYYESAKAIMKSEFREIEDEIFDCAYFKNELLPQYEKNKEDIEVVKYVYNKLRTQGCEENDEALQELKGAYESLATEINAQLESDRRLNNPGYDAVQLQKEGDYEKAAARYQEAINQEDDPDAKAQFYYSLAFIQTWQFSQYGKARKNISEALQLKKWGKPYILWGDIYAKMSTGCREDWDKRLAILAALEKYGYAKSVDPEVADDANRRIGQYTSAKPDREEGFMRKVNPGDKVRCGCGIGETVTISFKN